MPNHHRHHIKALVIITGNGWWTGRLMISLLRGQDYYQWLITYNSMGTGMLTAQILECGSAGSASICGGPQHSEGSPYIEAKLTLQTPSSHW